MSRIVAIVCILLFCGISYWPNNACGNATNRDYRNTLEEVKKSSQRELPKFPIEIKYEYVNETFASKQAAECEAIIKDRQKKLQEEFRNSGDLIQRIAAAEINIRAQYLGYRKRSESCTAIVDGTRWHFEREVVEKSIVPNVTPSLRQNPFIDSSVIGETRSGKQIYIWNGATQFVLFGDARGNNRIIISGDQNIGQAFQPLFGLGHISEYELQAMIDNISSIRIHRDSLNIVSIWILSPNGDPIIKYLLNSECGYSIVHKEIFGSSDVRTVEEFEGYQKIKDIWFPTKAVISRIKSIDDTVECKMTWTITSITTKERSEVDSLFSPRVESSISIEDTRSMPHMYIPASLMNEDVEHNIGTIDKIPAILPNRLASMRKIRGNDTDFNELALTAPESNATVSSSKLGAWFFCVVGGFVALAVTVCRNKIMVRTILKAVSKPSDRR